jgi:NAD-dependent oxidoreductase involved in siderophore biosynthesis
VKNAAGDATIILTALGMIGEQVVRAASMIPGLYLAGLLAQAEQDAAQLAGELGIPFTTKQIKSVVAASHQKVFGITPTNG